MAKVAEFRGKTTAELNSELEALLRQQFKLRLTKSAGELKDFSKVKKVRRDIARVLTVLTESANT